MYDALAIVRPDSVIRWHRAGFKSFKTGEFFRPCISETLQPSEKRTSSIDHSGRAGRAGDEIVRLQQPINPSLRTKYFLSSVKRTANSRGDSSGVDVYEDFVSRPDTDMPKMELTIAVLPTPGPPVNPEPWSAAQNEWPRPG